MLKEVHPDVGISKQGMQVMQTFAVDMFDRIMVEASRLCRISGKATLSSREIQTAGQSLPLPLHVTKYAHWKNRLNQSPKVSFLPIHVLKYAYWKNHSNQSPKIEGREFGLLLQCVESGLFVEPQPVPSHLHQDVLIILLKNLSCHCHIHHGLANLCMQTDSSACNIAPRVVVDAVPRC